MSTVEKGFFQRAKEFIPQVKQEITKVTWPTRKETTLTTAFVVVFAIIAALFFMVVDRVALKVVHYIIGIAS